MSEDRDECLGLGCDDFVSKPIEWDRFLAKLTRLLRMSRPRLEWEWRFFLTFARPLTRRSTCGDARRGGVGIMKLRLAAVERRFRLRRRARPAAASVSETDLAPRPAFSWLDRRGDLGRAGQHLGRLARRTFEHRRAGSARSGRACAGSGSNRRGLKSMPTGATGAIARGANARPVPHEIRGTQLRIAGVLSCRGDEPRASDDRLGELR